jgi:hypothetical protein
VVTVDGTIISDDGSGAEAALAPLLGEEEEVEDQRKRPRPFQVSHPMIDLVFAHPTPHPATGRYMPTAERRFRFPDPSNNTGGAVYDSTGGAVDSAGAATASTQPSAAGAADTDAAIAAQPSHPLPDLVSDKATADSLMFLYGLVQRDVAEAVAADGGCR